MRGGYLPTPCANILIEVEWFDHGSRIDHLTMSPVFGGMVLESMMVESIEKQFELYFQSLQDGEQAYGYPCNSGEGLTLLGFAALWEMVLGFVRAMSRRSGRFK